MTNGQHIMNPNLRRSQKLLVWAVLLIGLSALVLSAWEPWALILSGGFFVLGLLFAVWGLSVGARERGDN
jgi:hypothetical protein